MKALTIVQIHTGLRATRITRKHGEGATSDCMVIKAGTEYISMDWEQWQDLVKGAEVLDEQYGPTMLLQDVCL